MLKFLLCFYIFLNLFVTCAQASTPEEYTTPELDFSGVGLLSVANKKKCTTTIVSPDTILTAAHCVYDSKSSKYYPPKVIGFRPSNKYTKNQATQDFVAIKTYTVGMKSFPKGNFTQSALIGDWALITLAKPLHCTLRKLALAKTTSSSHQLIVAGFPQGNHNQLVIDKSCQYALPPKEGEMIRLKSCQLKHGDSGAPLMQVVDGKLTIIGIISAGVNDSKGRYRVFAVPKSSFTKRISALNQQCTPAA
jgi:protease YdgD